MSTSTEENNFKNNKIVSGQEQLFAIGIVACTQFASQVIQLISKITREDSLAVFVFPDLPVNEIAAFEDRLKKEALAPVVLVEDGANIESGTIYLPGKLTQFTITMSDGAYRLQTEPGPQESMHEADYFFYRLCKAFGSFFCAIILADWPGKSLTGIKYVKKMGGFVIGTYFSETARDLPAKAIEMGLIDKLTPVETLIEEVGLLRNGITRLTHNAVPDDREWQTAVVARNINNLLTTAGYNFTGYGDYIVNRIKKRMVLTGQQTSSLYFVYANKSTLEKQVLLQELLSSYSDFSCLAEFEKLKEIDLLQTANNKTAPQEIRIWVMGCATGEEAYALAILYAEKIRNIEHPPIVKIFATDINSKAIAIARNGLYAPNEVSGISADRLAHFFTKQNGNYRVSRQLREMVIFSIHNLTTDPPFSRMNLVCCRNMLPYFDQKRQHYILAMTHFALLQDCFLLLGKSDFPENHTLPYYQQYKPGLPVWQSIQVNHADVPLSASKRHVEPSVATGSSESRLDRNNHGLGNLHLQLLEACNPPSVVINDVFDIVHLSASAGQYFEHPGGVPTFNVFKVIRPELRTGLRIALYNASQKNTAIDTAGIQLQTGNRKEIIQMQVRPVVDKDNGEKFFLLFFKKADAANQPVAVTDKSQNSSLSSMEEEISHLNYRLKKSGQQYQLNAEELKASNEELQAMNEELRTAAEERERSREELRSVNEELSAVNHELKLKIAEADVSNSNLTNLVNSSDIATIFLNRNMRIVLFTPAASNIFNLIPSDHGRLISDITHKLDYNNLLNDAALVLEKLHTIEKEIWTTDGRFFIIRLLPYRTEEQKINGVVITFMDITNRKRNENALRMANERFLLAEEAANGFVYDWYPNAGTIDCSEGINRMLGYAPGEICKEADRINLIHPADRELFKEKIQQAVSHHGKYLAEYRLRSKQGNYLYVSDKGMVIQDGNTNRIVGIITDISETKKTELALKQSVARFQTLTNAIPQIVWSNDAEGKTFFFNYRWFEYTGMSDEQSGSGWLGAVHAEDEPASAKAWKQALVKKEVFSREFRLRRYDGLYRWHIVRCIPLKDQDDKIFEWFGSATDIDDLKTTEEYLRISRERMRVTMQSALDFAIITTNAEGIIEGWSLGAERIFGYTEQELIGRHADILFTPEDREAGIPKKEIETAQRDGRAIDERWHLRKDGSRFFMSGVMAPMMNKGILGYVKVARDITERKRSEQALFLSEERHRIALESAHMGAWDWYPATNKIMGNPRFYSLLGLEQETNERDFSDFLKLIHPEDIVRVKHRLHETVGRKTPYQDEFRIVKPANGEVLWISAYGRPIGTRDDGASRMVGVIYDITEAKNLEQQKNDFIGIASHELKTPVTGIKAYTDLLKKKLEKENNSALAITEKLDQQVDRLIKLIRDLLDTTKMMEGQLKLNLETFDITELITERMEELKVISDRHQLVFNSDVPVIINADRERIGQVLANFISNAIKYSPQGGNIVVAIKKEAKELMVSVSDEGIGIAKEKLKHIFDRFYRVSNLMANTYPGIGLGLYIAAEIIYRHGGSIGADSKPGEGSVFYFRLPL